MSRTKLLIAVVAFAVASIVCFNLWLSPLPSPATVRRLLENNPVPRVSSPSGSAVGTIQDPELRVEVVDTAVGVVAVYASTQGYGSTKLERSLFGWQISGPSWGPLSALTTTPALAYKYDQEFDYIQFRNRQTFNSAELLWGFRRSPQVQSIVVTYSNGATTSYALTDNFFSIVFDTNGAMCSFQVTDGQGQVVETQRLEPRQPAWIDEPEALCQ